MDSKRISKRELIKQIHTKIDGIISESKKELIEQIYTKVNGTISKSDLLNAMNVLEKNVLLNFMNVLEDTVYENLKKATEKESIIIALFEGLNIESVYIPQKTKRNNLTGKVILTASKIKPKATFTRTCCEKLSKDVR